MPDWFTTFMQLLGLLLLPFAVAFLSPALIVAAVELFVVGLYLERE